jgi:Glycine zipper
MIMRTHRLALVVIGGLGLSGCAGGLTPTQQNVGIGALGGGAVGGLVGSFSGNAGLGALIGAGIGGVGGYAYDQSQQPRRNNRRGQRYYD